MDGGGAGFVSDTPEIAVVQRAEAGDPALLEPRIRLLSLIFICFAAFCLIAPLLQTIHPVFRSLVRPLDERREPGPFPPLGLLLGTNGDFARDLNAWFDDRVGFRALFIRMKNQIDYSLFSTSHKVQIGKDGWLFDGGNVYGIENLSAIELAALENRFTTLAQRLHEKGIRLVVVGYPDKTQIYPDKISERMPPVPVGGNFDKLRHFLASQPSLTFIDAKALLQRERTRTTEHLYAVTDPHPTEAGQIPVAKEIVTQIAKLEGRPDMPWRDFKFQHGTFPNWGAEARFLAVLRPVYEPDYPTVTDGAAIGGNEPDGKWIIADRVALDRADNGVGRPFDWEFRSNPDLCPQRLPGTVLFGNSFSDFYWALGLQHYFCFIRRTRDPMSRFKLFYETMPPDTKYMIFQFVSTWLPGNEPPDDY